MPSRRTALAREPMLVVAIGATAVLVVAAALFRFSSVVPDGAALPQRLLGVLVATACTLVATLAVPRAPGVAWSVGAMGAAIASLELVAAIRALVPFATGSEWRALIGLAGGSLCVAGLVAAGSAARRRHGRSRATIAALGPIGVGVAATFVAGVWLAAAAAPSAADGSLRPLQIAGPIGLAVIAFALAVGLARDLAPPLIRALARERAIDPADQRGRIWRFLPLLAQEILPTPMEDRARVAEEERAKLAADIHATVLPDLRRAASTAESAGVPESVRIDLRRALEDVEQLMHRRQAVVLEQFGLVAALEWLAERTEERAPIRVELELGAELPADRRDIDPVVARSAFRIALLALDNVVRHAGATTARIGLAASGPVLELEIRDDGRKSRRTASGGRTAEPGGRGLTDMRAEAATSKGSLSIALEEGVEIRVRWPEGVVAAPPATLAAPITAIPEAEPT